MDQLKNLRTYNVVMSAVHYIQAVLMLFLSNNFALPITTSYVEFEPISRTLQPVMQHLAELRIAPLVALFLFLSGTAHLMLSLPKVYDWYSAHLKIGINYARWYEYAFSSSIMIVVISMLVGVYDLSLLIMLFSMNAMMILWGLMMERHNQLTKKTDWVPYIIGCLAGVLPWIVIALFLFNAGEPGNRAPDFVYWIFFSIFLFFNVFAVNMVLQYKKIGKWRDYVFGERVYILLSLLAKSLLAWQVFAATLRPV